jgi:AcrR family transcriptional regulator
MEKRSKRRVSKRLTREQWLSLALDVVARKGGAKLRIDRLVRDLEVTKGSFYWHFKNRDDFVRSLVDYWVSYSTSQVIEEVNRVGGDAKKRFYVVLEKVTREDLGRYDLAMRAWAALEPAVARVVTKVDAQRLSYVRGLFSEMSFRGQELELRARAFVCYMAGEHVFYARESKKEQIRKLKQKYKFFTRP